MQGEVTQRSLLPALRGGDASPRHHMHSDSSNGRHSMRSRCSIQWTVARYPDLAGGASPGGVFRTAARNPLYANSAGYSNLRRSNYLREQWLLSAIGARPDANEGLVFHEPRDSLSKARPGPRRGGPGVPRRWGAEQRVMVTRQGHDGRGRRCRCSGAVAGGESSLLHAT